MLVTSFRSRPGGSETIRGKKEPSSKFAVAFTFRDCLVGCLFAVLPTGTSPASRLGERNFGETRPRVPLALSPALGECFAGARLSVPAGRQPGSGAGRWEGRGDGERPWEASRLAPRGRSWALGCGTESSAPAASTERASQVTFSFGTRRGWGSGPNTQNLAGCVPPPRSTGPQRGPCDWSRPLASRWKQVPLSRVLTDREARGAPRLQTQDKPVQRLGHLWALTGNCCGRCQEWGPEMGLDLVGFGGQRGAGRLVPRVPTQILRCSLEHLVEPAQMFSSPRSTGTRLRSAQGACRRPPRVSRSLRELLAGPDTQGGDSDS